MSANIGNAVTALNIKVQEQLVKPAKGIIAGCKPLEARSEHIAKAAVATHLGRLAQSPRRPLHDRVLEAQDTLLQNNNKIRSNTCCPITAVYPLGLEEFNAIQTADLQTIASIEKFAANNADLISQVKKLKESSSKEYDETLKTFAMAEQVAINALAKISQ
jgi:hypothetical protein